MSNAGQKPERLSRSARIIGFVSLLSDISTEMAYPLIPALVTQVLNAPVTALGVIEGISQGAVGAITGFSGWLSDRLGHRKRVALVGYTLTAIAKPVVALAGSWMVLLGARLTDRIGKGIRSVPRDALLAESSPRSVRGRAFGFERTMDSLGAVLGPLVALALVGWGRLDTRSILLLSTVPAAAAVVMMMMIRERREDVVTGPSSIRLTLAGTTAEFRWLLVIAGVFGLANSANVFLILRAQQLGLTTGWVVLAYGTYNAVAALAAMPAGAASDRFGRRGLLIAGFLIHAGVYAGLATAPGAWAVWPLFAIYGLFPALTEGIAKAMAVDTSGAAGRATAIGMYSAVTGLAQIAASYIGGVLWEEIDSSATFYFGGALAVVAAAMMAVAIPRGKRP
jgi:MFS family permease